MPHSKNGTCPIVLHGITRQVTVSAPRFPVGLYYLKKKTQKFAECMRVEMLRIVAYNY